MLTATRLSHVYDNQLIFFPPLSCQGFLDLNVPHYLATDLPVDPRLDGQFLYCYTQGEFANEPEALHMMRRCARIVSHVMRAHGWSMPCLCEISLEALIYRRLNFNTKNGVRTFPCVDVQLRQTDHPETSRSIDEVVQTLLHELAHIDTLDIDDHGLEFYANNVALLIECEEAVTRGKVAPSEVPTRATMEFESKLICDKLYREDPDDPLSQLILPETLFWPELRGVRVYSRIGGSTFQLPPKPTRVARLFTWMRSWMPW